jgi:hypothetical protein
MSGNGVTESRASSLGPHDFMLLDQWARQLYDAFAVRPYLVGSVRRGERQWRDVDVRILLPEGAAWLGEIDGLSDTIVSLRLRTVNLAISLWGRQVTGLPIDFQFQPDAEFHAHDDEGRSALGISVHAVVQEAWDRRHAFAETEVGND